MNIASIDVGTNTVLLLIANVNLSTGSLTPLLNVHKMPRIGKGIKEGGIIRQDKIAELKKILIEYLNLAAEYRAQKIIATATNVFRIASNAKEVIESIKSELNIDIKIASGEEEAILSFLGATSGITVDRKFLVIDIGGGSTEIISGSKKSIEYKKSFQIGAVAATEKYLLSDPPGKEQICHLEDVLSEMFIELNQVQSSDCYPIAIAGTPTTLACVKLNLTEYDEKLIELSELNLNDLERISSEFSQMTCKQINNTWEKIMRGRADIILAGSLILLNLMKLLKLTKVHSSSRGIRYGAVVKFINEMNPIS